MPVKIAEYSGWVSVLRVDEDTGSDETLLNLPDDPSQPATLTINAKLRNKVGMVSGTPILILPKGTKVNLTEDEELIGNNALWKRVIVKNQNCCVCPPLGKVGAGNVFTILVASAEGWIDWDLLNS